MGKERAYSAKPSITSGDKCRASLPGRALLLSMGAGEADGGRKPPASCPSLRPNATKATGPNPVPTNAPQGRGETINKEKCWLDPLEQGQRRGSNKY